MNPDDQGSRVGQPQAVLQVVGTDTPPVFPIEEHQELTVPLGTRPAVLQALIEGKGVDAIATQFAIRPEQVERFRTDVISGVQIAEPAEARLVRSAGEVATKVLEVYFDKRKEATKDQVELHGKQGKLALGLLTVLVAGIVGITALVGYYKPEILQNTLLIVAGLVYLLVVGGNDTSVLSKLFKRLLG